MNKEVKHIADNLKAVFDGMPWHGNSLTTSLAEVDVAMAFYRPLAGKHNIAELVAHLLVWRQFVVEILDKNYDSNVDIGAMADFPKVDKSERIWQELLIQLDENQILMIDKINILSDVTLDYDIPKKPFTYRYLLEGIIYHDVYHCGQIGLLKSAYLAQKNSNEDITKNMAKNITNGLPFVA